LSATRPDVLSMIKEKYATWQRQMAMSEPRGPFRDY
jgi:hypothetical protein